MQTSRPTLRDTARDLVVHPEWVDEGQLRLGVALLLAVSGIFYFRLTAVANLAAALAGGVLMMAALHVAFRMVGLRTFGRLRPGLARGLAAAILLACLLPPGLPLLLVVALSAAAVLVEGRLRSLAMPLAITGPLLAWPIAWLWQAHFATPYLRPFDLRPLAEPIRLWTQSQVELDPGRLYAGNVAGPLGATSFGVAAVAFLVLAYARRCSWVYLGGFAVPVLLGTIAAGQPPAVYLLSGPGLVFAGLIGGDVRRLPIAREWRAAAGVGAGIGTAILLRRGLGFEAFGAGVLGAGLLIGLFQLYGLTGSPAIVSGLSHEDAAERRSLGAGPVPLGIEVAALVVLAPAGLFLVWRDPGLSVGERTSLVALGTAVYILAAAATLLWVYVLRVPV